MAPSILNHRPSNFAQSMRVTAPLDTPPLCSALGLVAHPCIAKALLGGEDASAPIIEFCIDSPLGSAALRAFCAALLGKGVGMRQTGYKHAKSLRIWRAGCGDPGIAAVVGARLLGFATFVHFCSFAAFGRAFWPL